MHSVPEIFGTVFVERLYYLVNSSLSLFGQNLGLSISDLHSLKDS